MFSFNKEKDGASQRALSHNSLVKQTEITGNIQSETDIRIDGILHGNLECKAKVVIGESGDIKGDVNCLNALIEGKVEGNVDVKQCLDLRKKATILGDIQTAKLIIEDGASFNGVCKMG